MKQSVKGVVYLAIGSEHLSLALQSINHLRLNDYRGPIRLVTDSIHCNQKKYPGIEIILVRLNNKSKFCSRNYKTRINRYAFDQTLFLDADTLPISPIDQIWDFLGENEVAFALDRHPDVGHLLKFSINDPVRRQQEYKLMQDQNLANHPFYNSGVMLFRKNERTDNLFSFWHSEWKKFRSEDQLALVRALHATGMVVTKLSADWNQLPKKFESIEQAKQNGVRILHFLSKQRPLLKPFLHAQSQNSNTF